MAAPQPPQPPYPRPVGPQGTPEPTGRRRWSLYLLIPVLALAGVTALVGVGLAFLHAIDPMGDEWVCSEGEVPAGRSCYPEGQPLPAGVSADPLGNRPMAYNCDKDGWTPIEHDTRDRRDCLNDDLPMPSGWHAVQ
ncbi:MAG: hypothetical protein WBP61_00535 [Nocardioides sp.]